MEVLIISKHCAERSIIIIIRFGIDLAKSSFAVCGVDENEHITLRKTLYRKQLLQVFANQIRGFLAEFGIVVPKGVHALKQRWPELRRKFAEQLPELAWRELDALHARLRIEPPMSALYRDIAVSTKLRLL